MKYLIFNIKANKTLDNFLEYKEEFLKLETKHQLIIAPSNPFLYIFKDLDLIHLAAQDVSKYKEGSFTGEVTAAQISSLNTKYVIIGHSERKNLETEKDLIAKITNAAEYNMKVIYCIGETKEEFLRGKTQYVLEKQIAKILNNIPSKILHNLIIAYEPVWSIGTGQLPDSNRLFEVINFIKTIIKSYYYQDLPVVYGGSVTPKNIQILKQISPIDGFLIGTASLDISSIKLLIESLNG